MASAKFYMVYIKRKSDVTFEEVKKKMDLEPDWYRIGESLCILYSASYVEELYQRLAPLVKDSGSVFICKLDEVERQGWMTKEFWDWIHSAEESQQ